MNDSEKIILEKIKNLRNQRGFSQSKLAQEIGISQTGYAKIERGDTDTIPLSVAIGIAKSLNVGFNELFDIDGDSHKIDNLWKTIEDQKQKIEELKDQITLLKNEKEHIKAHLVMQMVSSYSWEIGAIDYEYAASKSEERKSALGKILEDIRKTFNSNKDYYIKTGFLSESDFKNHYNEMKGMYMHMPDDKENSNEMPF